MKSGRVRPFPCINCGKLLDARKSVATLEANGVDDLEANISVCFTCRHVAAFKPDGTLRELTSEEIVALAGQRPFKRVMRALADFDRWRKANPIRQT